MSLTALAIALSLAVAPVMTAADLSNVQWENRVLVLFAEAGDPAYLTQRAQLEVVRDGLAERDMLVLGVSGNGVTALFGGNARYDAAGLRQSLGASDNAGFEAVLIGKDGGVKQRWTAPVSADELFAIIDAMPMRASEMRR